MGANKGIWCLEIYTEPGKTPSLADVEARHISQTLTHFEGNKSEAAKALGIDRRTLYRKLKALGQ